MRGNRDVMNRSQKFLWIFFNVFLITAGTLALAFSLPQYEGARHLADNLAPDHSFERFTPVLYLALRVPFIILGTFSVLTGILSGVKKQISQVIFMKVTQKIVFALKRLKTDTIMLLQHAIPHDPLWAKLGVLVITFAGLVVRLLYINRPMIHDEAYTYVAFASGKLVDGLADYHLPNNHLLHTFFVHLSTRLFGIAPWAVRLPALTAGVLTILAVYKLTSSLYNRKSGLLAASFVAMSPYLIDYSTNARGYTMIALLTLLTWSLGNYVRTHANSAAWLLMGILGALGFYTVPVFLYPYGILFTWLLLSCLFNDISSDYAYRLHFLKWMILAGLTTIFLTALFYAPVFIRSGIGAVIGNTFVKSLTLNEFFQVFPDRMIETWIQWTQGVSPVFIILLLVGLVCSIIFHRRSSTTRIPIQAAVIFCLVPLLLIQRPNPWTRIWTTLLPVILMWSAAGLVNSWEVIGLKIKRSLPLDTFACTLTVIIVLFTGSLRVYSSFRNVTAIGSVEKIVLYLRDNIASDDIVVVSPPDDAPLWYYWQLYEMPKATLQTKNRSFQQAYVVVNLPGNQTIDQVINERGPDIGFVNLENQQIIGQFGNDDLFLVQANSEVLEKALRDYNNN